MFCTKCGKENADDAKFCAGCGTTIAATENVTSVEKHQLSLANVDKGKVRSALKGSKIVSRKDIACENCDYVGVMTWKSSDKFTFSDFRFSLIGFIVLVVVAVMSFRNGEGILHYIDVILLSLAAIIGGFYLSVLRITKTNIFECPNCKNELAKAVFTRPNV